MVYFELGNLLVVHIVYGSKKIVSQIHIKEKLRFSYNWLANNIKL